MHEIVQIQINEDNIKLVMKYGLKALTINTPQLKSDLAAIAENTVTFPLVVDVPETAQ